MTKRPGWMWGQTDRYCVCCHCVHERGDWPFDWFTRGQLIVNCSVTLGIWGPIVVVGNLASDSGQHYPLWAPVIFLLLAVLASLWLSAQLPRRMLWIAGLSGPWFLMWGIGNGYAAIAVPLLVVLPSIGGAWLAHALLPREEPEARQRFLRDEIARLEKEAGIGH